VTVSICGTVVEAGDTVESLLWRAEQARDSSLESPDSVVVV